MREVTTVFKPDPDEYEYIPTVSTVFEPDSVDQFCLTQPAGVDEDGSRVDMIVMTIGQARDLAAWIQECIDGQ